MSEIAIVGYGGVFPDARNPREFFQNLLDGKRSVRDLRQPQPEGALRHDMAAFYHPDKKASDKSFCPYGAYIDRRWISESDRKTRSALESVGLDVAAQALEPLRGRVDFESAEIIIGLCSADGEVGWQVSADLCEDLSREFAANSRGEAGMDAVSTKLKEGTQVWNSAVPRTQYTVPTYFLHLLKKTYGIRGHGSWVDAACGSSLGALYAACGRLRAGETDLVISGGIDLHMNPLPMVLFAKVGALSENPCVPFDQSADGVTLSEAAVLYALMRLEDAVEKKLPIYGVIEGCGASTDGAKGGITEPTVEGQLLAYSRAYRGSSPGVIDYVEAHGTGTKIGDPTELRSITRFFTASATTLVGSAKANIGHAMGAAGAVSLVKCLEMIHHRKAPPIPAYFKKLPPGDHSRVFVNRETIDFPTREQPMRLGVSCFGFGGANYHLVLREHSRSQTVASSSMSKEAKRGECLVSARTTVFYEEIPKLLKRSSHRIPPKSVERIDRLPLASLLATENLFREIGINPKELDGANVSVVSGTSMLDSMWKYCDRLVYQSIKDQFRPDPESPAKAKLFALIDSKINALPEITEDSLVNTANIAAGRVAKAYDFRGASFNVNADLASGQVALMYAKQMVENDGGAVVVLSAIQKLDEKTQRLTQVGVDVFFLVSQEFAMAHELPVKGRISEVAYRD